MDQGDERRSLRSTVNFFTQTPQVRFEPTTTELLVTLRRRLDSIYLTVKLFL